MKTQSLDLDQLNADDPKVKYGFAKELLKIGTERPETLYPYFEHWEDLLTNDNNILKWTAIDIIGYLSAVDTDNKTDGKIKDLLQFLHGGHLITCNHAIFALGLIAQNKPEYRKYLIRELLAISDDTFETETCKSIATGKVLETLEHFISAIQDDPYVTDFIRLARQAQRNATRKKADRLLKKIEKAK